MRRGCRDDAMSQRQREYEGDRTTEFAAETVEAASSAAWQQHH